MPPQINTDVKQRSNGLQKHGLDFRTDSGHSKYAFRAPVDTHARGARGKSHECGTARGLSGCGALSGGLELGSFALVAMRSHSIATQIFSALILLYGRRSLACDARAPT